MGNIESLIEIMARLRDPECGCPWDREQTFASLVPHTLEETYEVIDAIEGGRLEDLREELGDLLFQVVFYSQLASERGVFGLNEVAATLIDKLIGRHPHVFANAVVIGTDQQSAAWEAHKTKERATKDANATSILDGIAAALPALLRAVKLQRRAAAVGFDWVEIGVVFDAVRGELDEVRAALGAGDATHITEEIGDLLFACVNLARFACVDPESALRSANQKFERRFRYIEQRLQAQGQSVNDATLAEMDALWEEAKRDLPKKKRAP